MPLQLLLPLTAIVGIGHAFPWAGPAQTEYATSTANWSPAPTSNSREDESFLELIRRDIFPVSVCGWIGGSAATPAYCSTQSSCVWNSDNGIVGCCAISSSECKFYTSCVDLNSPTQEGDSDDVYTCKGLSVCYSNNYPDNYIQWGCGSSDWATTVATSYEGMGQDLSLQIIITGSDSLSSPSSTSETPSATSTPSSSSPPSTTSESTSSQSETQSSSTSSDPGSSSTTTLPPATQSLTPTPAPKPSHKAVGPIVGGVLGGIAFICALIALGLVARKKGWFSGRRPDPREGTAFLDSNPVFEMGGGPELKGGYQDTVSPVSPGLPKDEEIKGRNRLSELP